MVFRESLDLSLPGGPPSPSRALPPRSSSLVPSRACLAHKASRNRVRTTGEAADKAKAAALVKYPGGTVNRVLKLNDGSYAVHMIKIRWPHHVFVNKNFEVTGAIG